MIFKGDITHRTGMHQFGYMMLSFIIGGIITVTLAVAANALNFHEEFIAAGMLVGTRAIFAYMGHNLARWKNNGAEIPMTIFSAIIGWFLIAGYAIFSTKKPRAVPVEVEQVDLYLDTEWEEVQ